MKRTLILLCLFSATFSFGQFLETGLVWSYTHEPFLPPPLDSTRIAAISLVKDTIIDGKKAYVLEGSCGCGFLPRYLYQQEQQMFYYQEGQFHQLYDFALGQGDTLSIATAFSEQLIANGIDTVRFVIDSVTYSPHIGDDTLKIQHITALPAYDSTGNAVDFPQWGNRIIQHVGSDYCMFPMTGFCEGNSALRCLQLPSGEMINFTVGEGCLLNPVTGPEDLHFQIFPNPATAYIQIDNIPTHPYALRITDLNGQIMYQIFGIYEPHKTIDTSLWPRGVYFLCLKTKGYSWRSKKFVKG